MAINYIEIKKQSSGRPTDDTNIFLSGCQSIAIPVNVWGKMDAGLAIHAKNLYPDLLHSYRSACRSGLETGGIHSYMAPDGRLILCCATQKENFCYSDIRWVINVLAYLRELIEAKMITSLALPALGCSRAERLPWDKVGPYVAWNLDDFPGVPIECYIDTGMKHYRISTK